MSFKICVYFLWSNTIYTGFLLVHVNQLLSIDRSRSNFWFFFNEIELFQEICHILLRDLVEMHICLVSNVVVSMYWKHLQILMLFYLKWPNWNKAKKKKRTEIPVVFQVTREQCAGFFSPHFFIVISLKSTNNGIVKILHSWRCVHLLLTSDKIW